MEIYTKEEVMHMLKVMMVNEMYGCEKFDGGKIDDKYIESFAKRLFKNIDEENNKAKF